MTKPLLLLAAALSLGIATSGAASAASLPAAGIDAHTSKAAHHHHPHHLHHHRHHRHAPHR